MMQKARFTRKKILLGTSVVHLGVYLLLGIFPGLVATNESYNTLGFKPIVPYAAEEINLNDAIVPPTWQLADHFLGTDALGRDVLAGIIYGCQTSLLVSFPAMVLATFIGIALGLFSGYFGNQRVKGSIVGLVLYGVALLLGLFYGFYTFQFAIEEAFTIHFFAGIQQLLISCAIVATLMFIAYWVNSMLARRINNLRMINMPIDEGVLKLTELFSSIPRFILILALTAFVRPSLGVLVLIIGFTSWTGMTRLVRGEIFKVKGLQYVEAGIALGLNNRTLLLKHILPNAIPPTLVAFTFGLANLLALEATLSFLGIGLPPDFVSWGKIIAGVRLNLSAWWLAVFPGAYLALTVLALHNCSNYLMDKYSRQ